MIDPLPIPDELWAKVPPDAQTAIAVVILAMRQRIDELETRVGDLDARLKLNSTNSSKPPSSDPIESPRLLSAARSAAVSPGIAKPGASWYRQRRSARRSIVSPSPVEFVVRDLPATTPNP